MRIEPKEISVLEYLHDADLISVQFDFGDSNSRNIVLSVTCDPEAGSPMWDGKSLRIRLLDLCWVSFDLFGKITGKEQINTFGPHLSDAAQREIDYLSKDGIDCSGVRFCAVLQSGSCLEGICQDIEIDILPGQSK